MNSKIKIKVKGPAGYKQGVDITLDKYVTLIYGNNGVGKSILSNYLYLRQKEASGSKEFRTSSGLSLEQYLGSDIQGIKDMSLCVYNTSFIEDNFYQDERGKLKGLFSLGEKNIDAEKKVKELENKKAEKDKQRDVKTKKLNNLEKKEEKKTSDFKILIWKIKRRYYVDSGPIKFCMVRFANDQNAFFQEFKDTKLPNQEETIPDLNELEKDAEKLLSENASAKDPLKSFSVEPMKIEKSNLFKKEIVGSDKHPMATMIEEIKSGDWIHSGLEHAEKSDPHCPFCQQEMVKYPLKVIKEYFDRSYIDDIRDLENMRNKYEKEYVNKLSGEPKLHPDAIEASFRNDKYEGCYWQLVEAMQENLRKIEEKIERPSEKIFLQDTTDLRKKLNIELDNVNGKINAYNIDIKNQKATEERIKKQFWGRVRLHHDKDYQVYLETNGPILDEIKEVTNEINGLNGEIEDIDIDIQEQTKKIKGIGHLMDAINKNIRALAIANIELKEAEKENEDDPPYYQIQRKDIGEGINPYQTLSEGEKTLISFLYFLALCEGSPDANETVDTKKKIIVIDDPISSLSADYIFETASLIWYKLLKKEENALPFGKVLILTHHFYFFTEIIYYYRHQEKNMNIKKMYMERGVTCFQKRCMEHITTDYKECWDAIKRQGPKNEIEKFCFANAMRQIFEYFFRFMENKKIYEIKAFKEHDLENNAFYRFMNRGSHASNTALDSQDIQPEKWMKIMKKIFYDAKYSEHYDAMMKSE